MFLITYKIQWRRSKVSVQSIQEKCQLGGGGGQIALVSNKLVHCVDNDDLYT